MIRIGLGLTASHPTNAVFSTLKITGGQRNAFSGFAQGVTLNTTFTQVTEVEVEYPDGSFADSGTTQKSRDLELCDLPTMSRSLTDNLHAITNNGVV